MLRTSGQHKKRLRVRRQRHISVVKEYLSDLFSSRRSSRLPRSKHDSSSMLQPFCEPGNLGRFSASLDPFEGDE
jgi:hypothetical protein